MGADAYRQQLAALDEELADVYRRRRIIMEQFAALEPAVLPRPSRRTEKQQLVARCPRCGGRLNE